MSELMRDPIMGPEIDTPLKADEVLLAEWPADAANYWRGHGIMALIGGAVAGAVLMAIDNPTPWVGPLAAIAAMLARGAYLASEALAYKWRLTDRRLMGPGGRNVKLGEITKARPFFGDVQIITRGGDKHLMKYMADARMVCARIDRARADG